MIEEEENFDRDWLQERYPFDAEARDKVLESKVLTHFDEQSVLTLVDVGAGTGSNCLYFIEQFSQNQKWYLVEQNEALQKATIRRLKDFAAYHKYDFDRKKNTVTIKSIKKKVTVTIINDSLLNLSDLVDLKKVDLVMANAVFDLFSAAQIEQFVNIIVDNQLAFYPTLNYEGMVFLPSDPFDEVFIDQYNGHMERPQAFGTALGKNASQYIVELFEAKKYQISTAESTWRIEPDDIKMHYYLLNFMENALGELDLAPAMQANFEKWVQRKKDLIITRQQRLEIGHLDIFVTP